MIKLWLGVAVFLALVAAIRTTHVMGDVVDSSERPLAGVRVIAVRNGNILAETITTTGGQFELVVASDKAFDLVFRDGVYDTAIISDIVPGRELRITRRLTARNSAVEASGPRNHARLN